MELKELKCKNCGANLKVEPNAKDVTCNFCHTTFSVETMENTGYEFEKGRIKAQKEELSNSLKSAGDALNNTISNINGAEVEKAAKGVGIVFSIIFVVMFAAVALFIVRSIIGFNSAEKVFNSNVKSTVDKYEVTAFNSSLEIYTGTKSYMLFESALSDIVTINKKGEHKVEVVYNDIKTTDPDKIDDLSISLENKDYHISLDYGDDGFVNRFIIKDLD